MSSSSSSNSSSSFSSSNSSSSSNPPEWYEYNGANDYEPDNNNLDNPWDKTEEGSPSKSVNNDVDCDNGKRFTLKTSITGVDMLRYVHTLFTPWYEYVNNALGWSAVARLKVIDSGTECQVISIYDGTYRSMLAFTENKIFVPSYYIVESTQEYEIDTTDAYHTYTINVIGTALSIKVDDIERITATLDKASSSKLFIWGDLQSTENYGGEVYWDYIKYYV